MPRPLPAVLLALASAAVSAQQPAPKQMPPTPPQQAAAQAQPGAPRLEPGEGLGILDQDNKPHFYGDVSTVRPLGEMAKLVWLHFAGTEWNSLNVYYECANPACQPPKGHGHVDLKKALVQDCDDAFLFWANYSRADWIRIDGEGVTRLGLVGAFGPFLGDRLPNSDTLPQFTPEWMGRGPLLQASPEVFLGWLSQASDVLSACLETLGGQGHTIFDRKTWWFKAGACNAGTWVIGGDGKSNVLLFIPKPLTHSEAIARVKAVLGVKK